MKHLRNNYLTIFFKGILMGIADLVPGVSGGTIALITGIYKDLITGLNNLNFKNFNRYFLKNFKSNKLDFLSVLFLGIATSIIFFSKIILFFIDNYNNEVSSFFFGLIICSVYVLLKNIKPIKFYDVIILLISSFIIYQLLKIDNFNNQIDITYIFICGFLCSCAMILPGISGSYILLILGAYKFILSKLDSLFFNESDSYLFIIAFALGALIGILTFSRLIKWLFKNFENKTLIILTGFILGSLTKIIPAGYGEIEITNVYNFFTNDTYLILWVFTGIIAIIVLNKIGEKNEIQ